MPGWFYHMQVAVKSGVRSHALRLLTALTLVLLGFSFLAAAFSLRQPFVVAMDVGISGLRIGLLLMSLFWVQEVVSKDLENKTVLFAIAYPLRRADFIVGRYLGILLLTILGVLLFALATLAVTALASWGYDASSRPSFGASFWLVQAGVVLDLAVVLAFALLLATFAETPFLPLALGLAFAVAARGVGTVMAFMTNSDVASLEMKEALMPVLRILHWVLPDLSRLDFRVYALYGEPIDWPVTGYAMLMAVAWIVLALAGAAWQFSRREMQ